MSAVNNASSMADKERSSTAGSSLDVESQATSAGSLAAFEVSDLQSNGCPSYWTSPSLNNAASDESLEKASPRRSSCRCWLCFGCVGLLLLLFGLTLGLCWPKMPEWEIKELKVDKGDLNSMVKAFTDPNFNETLSLPVNTTVSVTNNNVLGATTGHGHLEVTYGGALLAAVTTAPQTVEAHSTSDTLAAAISTITPELSKELIKEVMPDFKLKVDVNGHVPVTIFGRIHIKATVSCVVDVNVLELVQDPNKLVYGHRCSYGASL